MDPVSWLYNLYLFATVFGVGVTAVDLLGILGEHHDTGDHPGDVATDQVYDATGHGSLILLRSIRLAVYFALGFGPLGLIAMVMGLSAPGSLCWSVPGGLLTAWLARVFFRWQQRDIDSSVRDQELLAERAVVLVPFSHTVMGRIRIQLGQSVIERYALAEDAGEAYCTDDVVEVVAEAQVAGITAQTEAEQRRIEMLRARYTAELLTPAEAERERRI